MFCLYKLTFGDEIIYGLIIYQVTLSCIPFLYKKMYYRHINSLNKNIKKMKEFE
jgi:hypothetical protein